MPRFKKSLKVEQYQGNYLKRLSFKNQFMSKVTNSFAYEPE